QTVEIMRSKSIARQLRKPLFRCAQRFDNRSHVRISLAHSSERLMSALGQKQTYAVQNGMSALHPKAAFSDKLLSRHAIMPAISLGASSMSTNEIATKQKQVKPSDLRNCGWLQTRFPESFGSGGISGPEIGDDGHLWIKIPISDGAAATALKGAG